MLEKLNCYVTRVSILLIAVALIAGMAGCDYNPPPPNPEIRTWYDLDAVRENLAGNYTLMNDLDSTTAGYTQLASPTANNGTGWQPIGTDDNPFTGTFNGQGYEISDLFINRPDEDDVGLFGAVEQSGVIKDIGVVNATVIGQDLVGSLAGFNAGTMSNSYSSSSVTGSSYHYHVGGLVGGNEGTVTNSHSAGSVTGGEWMGGLVGTNVGTVSNSYSNSSLTGNGDLIGGLVGVNVGTVSNSYSTGNVTGHLGVGGLVAANGYGDPGTVSNSYSTGSVTGESYVGGLVGGSTYGSTVSNSYSTGSVAGNLSVGGLVGVIEGGTVTDSYSVGTVTGVDNVGGLVGENLDDGDVSNSYSSGSVTGNDSIGGLVGDNWDGTVSNSYATGNVTGTSFVGGLVGHTYYGAVSNSYSTGSVTGVTIVGGLVGRNEEGSTVSNSYSTGNVSGEDYVGGLVGLNELGTVSNSFWDIETSGQATSAGGTGKTTAEMKSIATFADAGWNIIAVALNETNPAYIWNIVNNVTYPFLSWQP